MVAQGWKVAEHRPACGRWPALFKNGSLCLNALPRPFHVPGLRIGLAYAEAKSELTVQFRVSQVEIPAAVQAIHDRLIDRISSLMAKAHQVQGHGRGQFKVLIFADPI